LVSFPPGWRTYQKHATIFTRFLTKTEQLILKRVDTNEQNQGMQILGPTNPCLHWGLSLNFGLLSTYMRRRIYTELHNTGDGLTDLKDIRGLILRTTSTFCGSQCINAQYESPGTKDLWTILFFSFMMWHGHDTYEHVP
ncbi:hypothetical protein QZH41_014985, partial [Actinostola sp. cb2023]